MEALGRAHLLRARQGLYCQDAAIDVEHHLQRSIAHLHQAVLLCTSSNNMKNRTAVYDLARAKILHGELDEAERLLVGAGRDGALPLPAVFCVEPDFAMVRDAGWFKALEQQQQEQQQEGQEECGQYQEMKQALLRSGVGCGSVADSETRFVLFMGTPQGPLPRHVFEAAVAERERAAAATAGHRRLKERLDVFGLREKCVVPSDGNCQFAAVSDQLHNTFAQAAELRGLAVGWLAKHADWDVGNGATIAMFVPTGNFDDYLRDMARPGTWGDHLTLIALAEALGVRITVISSVQGDQYLTEIVPRGAPATTAAPLLLSHFAEFHYGSLTFAT